MSALAHVFEQAGLATVGLSLVRGQAAAGRAPRMLHCQFPLGRPLGRPNDPVFQHHVLAAAFTLLARTDVPVLVDFPETIDDAADAPLSCALPPRHDPTVPAAVDEAVALRPAYERQRGRFGITGVGRVGDADRIGELVGLFVRIADGEPWDQVATSAGLDARGLGAAGLDVRAYYEEAAVALADHVPGARQAESWFYRLTEAGAVLRRSQEAIKADDGPRDAWFRLVPVGHL